VKTLNKLKYFSFSTLLEEAGGMLAGLDDEKANTYVHKYSNEVFC
jgi:hypothetical protein